MNNNKKIIYRHFKIKRSRQKNNLLKKKEKKEHFLRITVLIFPTAL